MLICIVISNSCTRPPCDSLWHENMMLKKQLHEMQIVTQYVFKNAQEIHQDNKKLRNVKIK